MLTALQACNNRKEVDLLEIVIDFEKQRIDSLLVLYSEYKPITIVDTFCLRSKGSKHDFYSEGDYWWPDPDNPGGPYIRKDGLSNPGIFNEHRKDLIRFSRVTGAYVSKWILSGDEHYADKAWEHISAWFIDSLTRMEPNMLYAQAIKGRYSGRGIGIIDALHFIEVARSIQLLSFADCIPVEEYKQVQEWFDKFLQWMTSHPYGLDEMVQPNNHGTCWCLQVAVYASLTGNDSLLQFCTDRYREQLLPKQMSVDGSYHLELVRTKPYGYSLFNLDVMTLLVHVLNEANSDDLYLFSTSNGKNIHKGLQFIEPYIKEKSAWPYNRDVLYWDNWPVSHASLIIQGLAFQNEEYIELWEKLEHDPETFEIQRNLVMRYPLLWIHNEK